MKEREARIKKDVRIVLKDGIDTCNGTITNFSKTGLSIKTDHVFPTYKVIDILVKIGNQVIPLQGSVRWVKESPKESADRFNEIGVLLPNPPPEYTCHFK